MDTGAPLLPPPDAQQHQVPLHIYRQLEVEAPPAQLAASFWSAVHPRALRSLGELSRGGGFARLAQAPDDVASGAAGRKRALSAAFAGAAPAAAGGLAAEDSEDYGEFEVVQPPAYQDGKPLTAVPSNEAAQHRECAPRCMRNSACSDAAPRLQEVANALMEQIKTTCTDIVTRCQARRRQEAVRPLLRTPECAWQRPDAAIRLTTGLASQISDPWPTTLQRRTISSTR